MILHVQNPKMPQFRFEWHPLSKKVYVIRLDVIPLIGEPIGFEITTEGAAINTMLIWCRGYNAAKLEINNGKQEG